MGHDSTWDHHWHQASIKLVAPTRTLNKTGIQIEITANSTEYIPPSRKHESELWMNIDRLGQIIRVTNSSENDSRFLSSESVNELVENLKNYEIGFNESQPVAIAQLEQSHFPNGAPHLIYFQYSASREWADEGITISLWPDKKIEIYYHPQHFHGIDRKNIDLVNDGIVTTYAAWAEKKFAGLDTKSLAKFNKGSFINALVFMARTGLDISNPKVFWNQFSKEAPNFKSF